MFNVTITEKGGPAQTTHFDKSEVTIGRVKGNDIVLPKGNVSKRHSRIVVKDGKFIIVDLKSTNGTYVNGRKISAPQVIKETDKVYIGDFILTVHGDESAAEISGPNASPMAPGMAPPPGMGPGGPGGPSAPGLAARGPGGPGGPGGMGPGGPGGMGPGGPGGPGGMGPGGPGGPGGMGPGGMGPGGPGGMGPGGPGAPGMSPPGGPSMSAGGPGAMGPGGPGRGPGGPGAMPPGGPGGMGPGGPGGMGPGGPGGMGPGGPGGPGGMGPGGPGGPGGMGPGGPGGMGPGGMGPGGPGGMGPGGPGAPGMSPPGGPSMSAGGPGAMGPGGPGAMARGASVPGMGPAGPGGPGAMPPGGPGAMPPGGPGGMGPGGPGAPSGMGPGAMGARGPGAPGAGPGAPPGPSRGPSGPGAPARAPISGPGLDGPGAPTMRGPGGPPSGNGASPRPDYSGAGDASGSSNGAESDLTPPPISAPAMPMSSPAAAPMYVPAAEMVAGPVPQVGRLTMPPPAALRDARDNAAAARHTATGLVMELYTQRFDPRELPQTYPPDNEWRERAYSDLRGCVEEAAARFGPGVDRNAVLDHVCNEAVALGPLEYYLSDEAITEIHVHGPDRIVVERDGQLSLAPFVFTNADFLYLAALRILSLQGYVNGTAPAVSEVRFDDGTLVQVVLPPVAVGSPLLSIRKARRSYPNLSELVAEGALSNAMAEFLHQCIAARRTLLIAGPSGSGRTTLANALLGLVPDGTRLVVVESTAMLHLPHNTALNLEAQPASAYGPAVSMAELVEHAVRLRPERLVVDDLRGAEALGLLAACAGGAAGSLGVIAGISAQDALRRFEGLALLGADGVSRRGLYEQMAYAIDVVVVLNRFADGTRRVVEIAETNGVGAGEVRLETVFALDPSRAGGDAPGRFGATGYVPRFYRALEAGGVRLDKGIFRD